MNKAYRPEELTIVCAWCGAVKCYGIYVGGIEPLPGAPISHGICPSCAERQLEIAGIKPDKETDDA